MYIVERNITEPPSITLTCKFSAEAYAALEEIARETGRTKSEVLRQAIGLRKWFFDEKEIPLLMGMEPARIFLEKGRWRYELHRP